MKARTLTRSKHPDRGAAQRHRRRVMMGTFLSLAVVAAGVVVAVFRRDSVAPAQLPEISRTALGTEAAAIVEKHLDAVRQQPRAGQAWGRLGAVLKAYGLAGPAETCLAEAERLDPHEPRWPYLRGVLHENESVTDAVAHLRRASALVGHTPEMPRLRLARLLAETGHADARTEAETLLRVRPDCAPAQLLLAQLRGARGDWPEATRMAGECLSSPHTARAAKTLIALAHRRRGDTNAAERASREASSAPPDVPWPDPFEAEASSWCSDPRSLSDAAQRHLLSGRLDEAAPLIERLIREHPGFAEGWLLKGRLHYLRKEPAAAESAIRRHLVLEEGSVNGRFQLGMTLLAQQKFPEAAAAFEGALAVKPDLGPAQFNLGFARVRAGRLREAVDPFRQAIRYNPEKIDSYILLADLHLQLGEPAEAVRWADLAERLDPGDRRLPSLRQRVGR